ncbi:MAG: exodeoxyribonuclease VII large subunit [Candidatus Margulisiibacteriota bacterium]
MTVVLSVTELNQLIKAIIENPDVWASFDLKGELSNVKWYAAGGQLYFTLCDAESQINGVMYKSYADKLRFEPQNGTEVVVKGKLIYHHKRGTLMFQAVYMQEGDKGLGAKTFEALKQKLLAEGLFDEARKKAIPPYPKTVACITAPNSAAMWDFVSIVSAAKVPIHLHLIPATMQGAQSATSVIEAFQMAETYHKTHPLDALVLLRGGGAAEDLASFNDEALVRTLAHCPIPTLTAIGHEVDYTLADFAADLRCPTPTAAAKTLCEPFVQAKITLAHNLERAAQVLDHRVSTESAKLTSLLQLIQVRLFQKADQTSTRLDHHLHRLEQANPLHKLRQGFSITRIQNRVLKSVHQAQMGDAISTEFADGTVVSTITNITSHDKTT